MSLVPGLVIMIAEHAVKGLYLWLCSCNHKHSALVKNRIGVRQAEDTTLPDADHAHT